MTRRDLAFTFLSLVLGMIAGIVFVYSYNLISEKEAVEEWAECMATEFSPVTCVNLAEKKRLPKKYVQWAVTAMIRREMLHDNSYTSLHEVWEKQYDLNLKKIAFDLIDDYDQSPSVEIYPVLLGICKLYKLKKDLREQLATEFLTSYYVRKDWCEGLRVAIQYEIENTRYAQHFKRTCVE